MLEARRQVDSQKEKALVKVSRTLRQWGFGDVKFVKRQGGNDKMSACLHGKKNFLERCLITLQSLIEPVRNHSAHSVFK